MLERVPTVLTAEEILDKGFGRAAKIDIFDPVKYHRVRKTETARLTSAVDTIAETIEKFPNAFPNLDGLRDYNIEVLDIVIGVPRLKKALGSLKWAAGAVRNVGREQIKTIAMVKKSQGVDPFFQARKRAYGRISSIINEVDGALDVVREARDRVKLLPTVSPDWGTLVIAGYPNVGKTSLLRDWTASRAEINTYAFTTKRAEVGHFEIEDAQGVPTKYQVVDTPGLLDRPHAERNDVERQAMAALRHAADALLFILDPSELCGYDMEKQMALLAEVQKEMAGMPLLVVESKCDLHRTDSDNLKFSTTTGEGMDELRLAVLKILEFDDIDLDIDPLEKWRKVQDDDDGWDD